MRSLNGWLLALILLAGALLRGWSLHSPDHAYFDETYYVPAAQDYLDGRPDSNNVHPPLGKLQMASAILFFEGLRASGWNPLPEPVGWRLTSLLAGVGSLLLTYRLARLLVPQGPTALLATALLSLDWLHIVESRIAKLDQIQSFWILAGLSLLAREARQGSNPRLLAGAGLAFGCATACKWNGLFAAAAGLGAWLCLGGRRPGRALLLFALTIPLIYALSYAPLAYRERHRAPQAILQEIAGYHLRMWRFRADPQQFQHRYLSKLYTWPLTLRPVWYDWQEGNGKVRGIIGAGCPLFWWLAVLLLADRLVQWRKPDPEGRFLLVAYLGQWLPWCLAWVGGFLYYMLPCTPLMAIVVARELADWGKETLSRRLAAAYLVVLLAVTLIYLPFLLALPVPRPYFTALFPHGWI